MDESTFTRERAGDWDLSSALGGARATLRRGSTPALHDSILDAMRGLLMTRDWSAITLSDVARAAGISRQTIYNEFGSRQGLAQGYALRLADQLVDSVKAALDAHPGSGYESFLQAFRAFFTEARADPLVNSLSTGAAKPDLLQLVTIDSAPIISRASTRLSVAFDQTWPVAGNDDAGVVARAIVRLCLSYISMPHEAGQDVASDLARMIAPIAERHGDVNNP